VAAQRLVVEFDKPPIAVDVWGSESSYTADPDPRAFRETATVTVTIRDGEHTFTMVGTLAAPPRVEDTP
jgi:hypothetical protein